MADDRDDEEEGNEAEAEVKDYEKRIHSNRLILFAGIFLSCTVLCIMVTGLLVLFMRVSEIAPADGEPSAEILAMEERFATLERQLGALSDFRKGELKKVAAFTNRLEMVYADCSSEKTAPFKDLLISREKDFQALLKTISGGTRDLSGMVKGSKNWVNQHNKKLQLLIDSSVERQAALNSRD
jgi:hypothetical protein